MGRLLANVYRKDLDQIGFGQGDHAFIFNCDAPLSAAELDKVEAFAVDATNELRKLPRHTPRPEDAPRPGPPSVVFTGASRDLASRPLFILGSARSGTSAIVQALSSSSRYRSAEEGHFLEVLATLGVHLHKFYESKGDELARNTTIARIPEQFVRDGLQFVIVSAMNQIFPSGLWMDKTPSSNMIHLAPWLREIWPNARFIFMKRRAIENIQSRLSKFNYDFSRNCYEWVAAMEAWLAVRSRLQGAALELDQTFMYRFAPKAASRVGDLLQLEEVETLRLGQMLRHVQPQRQGRFVAEVTSLDETGWDETRKKEFASICGPMMSAFGYDYSPGYVEGDFSDFGCISV